MLRLLLSLGGPLLVRAFAASNGQVTWRFYVALVALSIVYGLAADCLMFVAIGAFFLRITAASASIGGSYLTLLYAAQNMGGMWHRSVTLALVERLTTHVRCGLEVCPVERDGYFVLSGALALVGVVVGLHLWRTVRALGALPLEAWKPSPA